MKTLIYKQPPNHPNVVPIMGISLDGGQCVMSALAPGGSLESRLTQLNWFQRLRVAAGAFAGLAALHAAGVVHGNLKTTNVFVADDGLDGLVGDYAAGRRPDFDKCSTSVLNYYDTAFVKGDDASNESDVYSMGIVLLELLASQRDGEVPAVQNGGGGGPLDEFADAAAQGGWPEDVAREVIELAAACVRPNARRRKSADIIARALKQIAQDEVDEAGNVVTLMRLADKACGTARDQSGELPRFDKMRARERARFEFAALKLQARWRGRVARRRCEKLKRSGMPAQIVADDGQDSTFTPEQVKAAVFIQTRWRGIMARKKARKLVAQKRGVTFQEDDDGTALTRKQLDELALAEREAEEREILHAEIFGRIAAMLADGDQEVQRVGATALAIYTDRDVSPDPTEAANCAVNAGILGPLVHVFTSRNQVAVTESARALENITVELPAEQNRALRAGALEACLRLIVDNSHPIALRASGARALRGLLLQNPPACRRAVEKGALDALTALMQVKDPEAQSASSAALTGLADADSEILQKLGVERLVGMAVRARNAPMRAATIAFVSKLARDSDTHEEIISAGGLELLIGMILRLNEEAVWGLASMSSVEDNWAQIDEVMTVDAFGALKDLIELGGEYGKEGAAWACCYLAGHPSLQVMMIKANVLLPLVGLVKSGSRRVKKAAERALKALAS